MATRTPCLTSHRILCAVVVLVVGVGALGNSALAGAQGATDRSTVVVFPFVNTSGAATDEWIGHGIAEILSLEIVAGLGMVIIPDDAERTASWRVDGSYQRVGDDLRIIARVVDVTTGTVKDTVKIDGQFDELFTLQDRLAAAVRASLATATGPTPRRVGPSPRSPEPAATRDPMPRPVVSAARASAGSGGPVLVGEAPPPPVPPAVISRDEVGRATVRAVRVADPISVDGRLDEAIYDEVEALSDFVQQEPLQGAPATERTEAWVLFDDDNFYLSARCWDSAPESQWIVNEMRRDNNNVSGNEAIFMFLDPFYDRRNGHMFIVNAIGGRQDAQTTDERTYDGDWNTVWTARTGRFEGGWTLEVAIPFKSLRYRPGREQVWGINIRRRVRWKSELAALTPLDPARGLPAIFQASQAATLVGLEAPVGGGRALEIKPYAISEAAGVRQAPSRLTNDVTGDLGFDVKYGVTQGLVADLTINTDFAQVEADEQQVNLTRFSLFFPEKRDFFLENQGIFIFGGARGASFQNAFSDTPILFYSRAIGLQEGREVPIQGGGRFTGRAGNFRVGLMNIQTGDVDAIGARATNFTVARVRRDVLRRSNVGLLFTGRSVSREGTGASQTYGVDGVFSFYNNLNFNTYWAQTSTPGVSGDDVSYQVELDYNADRYGVQATRLIVGSDFNPEVGFIRRKDFDRRFGLVRFSPRSSIAAVRKFSYQGFIAYILDRSGVLETREAQTSFGIEFESSDQVDVSYTETYELLKRPFTIVRGVTIPRGGYSFWNTAASFTLGQTRRLGGRISVDHGTFFSGHKTTLGFGRGRLELTPQFSFEPSVSYNRIDLPEGRFSTNLITTRTTYTISPLMFVSALVQYNSSNDSLGANVRLRWEYQPGSEFFVVYNEERDTLSPRRFPELQNRALIIKINRLFRF